MHLKAAAQPFIEFHLETVVIGLGLPHDAPDNLNRGIEKRGLPINARRQSPRARPVIADSGDRLPNVDRLNGIGSFRQERMMKAPRSRIGQHKCCVGCKLPLDTQVPLINVITLNIVVVVCPYDLRWPDRGRESRNTRRPHTRGWRGRTGRTDCTVASEEGSRCRVIEIVDVRLGQRIKEPKTAPNRRFAVVKRIPCETHPRLEVLECRVADVKLTDEVRRRTSHRPQVTDFTVYFRGVGLHFVT